MSRRWMRDIPHDVYEVLDSKGISLYVGMSMNVERRLLQHRRAAWFPAASRVLIETYPTMAAARHIEGQRIAANKPAGNSQQERWAASLSLGAELTTPSDARVVTL